MRDILVYLDGTSHGESIVGTAADIARNCGSRLILLYVVVTPSLFAGVGTTELQPAITPLLTARERTADAYLASVTERWATDGVETECVIVQGPLEESIVTCARSFDTGMIALADGTGNLMMRLFTGSLLERLLKKTGLPVVAVKSSGRSCRRPAR